MRICLITTSQPSANPRLVKEADALVEAGYHVHVIGAHRVGWATDADASLVATRKWALVFIDWRREVSPSLFWKTRIRHYVARRLQRVPGVSGLTLAAAIDRLTPELTRAARAHAADLYVAHNPGALPAAASAARAHAALLGFDAEDYHSGEFPSHNRSPLQLAIERVERQFVPQCDYLTAASSGIASLYEPLSRCGRPTTILNVFPLSSRPPMPPSATRDGPLRLYWFSQTIGSDRGLETVIQAMGRLPSGAIELHLRGRWHDGYEQELRAVAANAGVDSNRIVSHAPAAPDEMVRLAASYDVGLATETGRTLNRRVALTNKIFTYLLAGIPTLATRTPAQAELVDQLGAAARSYQPDDVNGAAAILQSWVDDRSSLAPSRHEAWAAAERRYNWDLEKHDYLRLIDNVLRGAKGRAPAGVPAMQSEPRHV